MDYIAIDIGASSGRLVHSSHKKGKTFEYEEIHRFKNYFENVDGIDYWNIDHLIQEILVGLEKTKLMGISKCYVGIDTWGVDYCLIDKAGQALSRPICYRDQRTETAINQFKEKMSLITLYRKTGIQIQPFNTIFQLLVEDKNKLQEAERLLLIPDYLGYVFTGNAVMEKSNASTMQLLNIDTHYWDKDILEILGVDETIFPELVESGTILGELKKDKFPDFDLPQATFITVASHDTASAVVGTPSTGDNWGYISSGTWSLIGVEIKESITSKQAYEYNFTNEYGAENTVRFLKNIIGMWLIQEVARIQDYQYSYAELAEMASKEVPFQQFINVNDARFLNPNNMIEEIQMYCRETNQKVPISPGEIARCVYDNLALYYGLEIKKIEGITGKKIEKIYIIGGGSNNQLLNQMTADTCNIEVEAGPSEATALGNLMIQMIATKIYPNVELARYDMARFTHNQIYKPDKTKIIDNIFGEYKKVIGENNLEAIHE